MPQDELVLCTTEFANAQIQSKSWCMGGAHCHTMHLNPCFYRLHSQQDNLPARACICSRSCQLACWQSSIMQITSVTWTMCMGVSAPFHGLHLEVILMLGMQKEPLLQKFTRILQILVKRFVKSLQRSKHGATTGMRLQVSTSERAACTSCNHIYIGKPGKSA